MLPGQHPDYSRERQKADSGFISYCSAYSDPAQYHPVRYLILETLLSEYSMTEEDNGVKWARRELARLDALTQ